MEAPPTAAESLHPGAMLSDFHAHTGASYCCSPDLTPELYAGRLAQTRSFRNVFITDHAMALYFPYDTAWSWSFICDSAVFDNYKDYGDARLDAHLSMLSEFESQGIVPGIEAEMMHDGRLTFSPDFRLRLKLVIGSVHWLPDSKDSGAAPDIILSKWLEHTHRLIDSGIDILGHPFRWIAFQLPHPVPDEVVKDVLGHAKGAGVAIELNSHYKVPTDEGMLREAAERGNPVALSSDSHRQEEVLDFSYHMSAISRAGLTLSDLNLLVP